MNQFSFLSWFLIIQQKKIIYWTLFVWCSSLLKSKKFHNLNGKMLAQREMEKESTKKKRSSLSLKYCSATEKLLQRSAQIYLWKLRDIIIPLQLFFSPPSRMLNYFMIASSLIAINNFKCNTFGETWNFLLVVEEFYSCFRNCLKFIILQFNNRCLAISNKPESGFSNHRKSLIVNGYLHPFQQTF